MKKSIFMLLTLQTIISLSVVSSYAQRQRLGIAPQEIILSGGKSSEKVKAFCFDRHIIIDKTYDYRHLQTDESAIKVSVANKTYSFSQAIEQKIIKVNGRPGNYGEPRLVLEITKLIPDTVTINVEKASVFRDTPGRYSNQAALETLTHKPSQDGIWKADLDRARLESLGYKSIEEFQQRNGIPEPNALETSARLEAQEKALIKRFEAVGLEATRWDTEIQSVSDNVRQFERKSGLEETGVYSAQVRSLFEKFEPRAKVDFANIRELGEFSDDSALEILRIKSSLDDDSFYTLYSRSDKLYEGNDISAIKDILAERADHLKVDNANLYLDLDFPSSEKANAFKATLKFSNLTLIEARPEAKIAFFTSRQPVQIISTTRPALRGGQWSSSINLNANRKITAIARIRRVVLRFVESFRSSIGANQSLASIVDRSRRASGALEVRFTDQYGKIHVVKLLRHRFSDANAE